jgi:hypothetical protein
VVLVAAAVAAVGASPAAAARVQVKAGTYRVTSSAGQQLKMVVAPCGRRMCLSSAPSQGSENEIELKCVNTSGGGDGVDSYEDYGPERISPSGKVRSSTKERDDDGTQQRTSSWTFTARGRLSGTARLTEAFDDGATCDSGTIMFKGRR